METTHEPLHKDKRMKDNGHTSFIWITVFFNGTFEYGDGGILKLLRWMRK
jgi:hypothetical protein